MPMNEIALSGIRAARTNLEVTGHNIANVATPWYCKQEAVQHSLEINTKGFYSSDLMGVFVDDIRRMYDESVLLQCWSLEGDYGFNKSYGTYNNLLESFMGEEDSNYAVAFNEFVRSLSIATADPSIMAYRQEVINTAGKLTARFNYLYDRMNGMLEQAYSHMNGVLEEANQLIEVLAEYNNDITIKREKETFSSILDDRDRCIARLSELIGVKVLFQDDYMINISLKSGQCLVSGTSCNKLQASRGIDEHFDIDLFIINGSSKNKMRVINIDGEAGGVLKFVEKDLTNSLDSLGWQAVQLAMATNKQLLEGEDLLENPGVELFNDLNDSRYVISRANEERVKGNAVPVVYIDSRNIEDLEICNYRIYIDNTKSEGIEVWREDTGLPVETTQIYENRWRFNGLDLEIENYKNSVRGDCYILTPLRNISRHIDVTLHDGTKLAFAEKDIGPGDNKNLNKIIDYLTEGQTKEGTLGFAYERMMSEIANVCSQQDTFMKSVEVSKEVFNLNRVALSGVNIDEEAANLIRFQQYYQANARVLTSYREIVNYLLNS